MAEKKHRTDSFTEAYDELQSWSLVDKKRLLQCLNSKGHEDLSHLSETLMKPTQVIEEAIEHYRALAADCIKQHYDAEKRGSRETKSFNESFQIPLLRWLRILLNNSKPENLQSEIAKAIRIIIDCEQFPKPEVVGKVDFKKMYLYLWCSFEGRPLPELNEETQCALNTCLVDLARECNRTDFLHQEFFRHLSSLHQNEVGPAQLKELSSPEVKSLRNLCSQTRYNPFGVPENFL